jgi:hypothetical protein
MKFLWWEILEKCWEQNIGAHHLYIDMQATYDTVWRMQIWSETHKLGFPKKLVELCGILYNEIYAEVKIGEHLSSKFKVNRGLRQGDAIAPLLFNVV